MLVAFSHLRWGFVWQRPQHLLTRFAREMPVVVVEEPEYHLQLEAPMCASGATMGSPW